MEQTRWDNIVGIVNRMNENLGRLNEEFLTLTNRINDLEVKMDNLRVESKNHSHGYVPPPRYGS